MRKYILLLIIVCIMPLFAIPAGAEERVEGYVSKFESIIPEDTPDLSDGEKIIENFSLKGLALEILSLVTDNQSRLLAFLFLLLGVVFLSALSMSAQESYAKQTRAVVQIIGSLAIFPFIKEAYSSVAASLTHIGDFFAALTPIAIGMTALGGGVSSASVQASGMYTALSLIGELGSRFFLPLAAFGLAVALVSSLGNSSILTVAKGVKGIFTWAIGIFSAIVTAVFSLQGLVASATDSATMRAARYTASSLIPVVGSAVSGALATLSSGLSYAKTIVGGGAIAVIVSLALAPLVMLLLYRLAFGLAEIISELVLAEGSTSIFKAYKLSLDMIISVYVMSVILYLFQVVLFLKIGAMAYD